MPVPFFIIHCNFYLLFFYLSYIKTNISPEVNCQNVRRYALDGNGCPETLQIEKQQFSPKVMVFLGIHHQGTFGLKFFEEGTITGCVFVIMKSKKIYQRSFFRPFSMIIPLILE